MKLCIDARMLMRSGIGAYVRNLIPYMKPFSPTLIVTKEDHAALPLLREYHCIVAKAPIYSLREQIELPLIIPSCDLFWSPHYNIPLLPIRAKKRIVTIHDLYHIKYAREHRLIERLYANFVIKKATQLSNHVITVSCFSRNALLTFTKVEKEKITQIYSGICKTQFSPIKSQEQIDRLRKQYHLGKTNILFVGNQKPHKNIQGLIRAFTALKEKEGQDLHLVIVGKRVGLRNGVELNSLIAGRTNIHVLDNVPDETLPLFYQTADLTVLPSFYEGFGFPALEAMRSMCPVIVSNRASLPEVCSDGAYYINPDHESEITHAMQTILDDASLQESLKHKGLHRADFFSWDKSAKEHIAVMEKVCSS